MQIPFTGRIPWNRVNWKTSVFLAVINTLAITAVPLYLWHYGLDLFQASMFLFFYLATGFSITLGYHRLFSHLAFKAKASVKFITLLFGACAFENSALDWCSDHRKHHKHVDHDDDPYDITKGFMWAHIGWLLFKLSPELPMDNVNDLRRDKLIMWQHRWCIPLAFIIGFGVPVALGFLWNGIIGALGGLLLAGVLRVFAVQHCTFFINSLCHTMGRRPYSVRCSARDSAFLAFFTFGEGYHNYHHEFQHDYRNGVKKGSFDPTKWTIWTLEKLGLVRDLRRVTDEKILLAEMGETLRRCSIVTKDIPVDKGVIVSKEDLLSSGVTLVYDRDIKMLQSQRCQRFNTSYKTLKDSMAKKISISKECLDMWRKESRELASMLS